MAFLAGDVMYHVSTTYHSPFVFNTSTFILITLCLCISVLKFQLSCKPSADESLLSVCRGAADNQA